MMKQIGKHQVSAGCGFFPGEATKSDLCVDAGGRGYRSGGLAEITRLNGELPATVVHMASVASDNRFGQLRVAGLDLDLRLRGPR